MPFCTRRGKASLRPGLHTLLPCPVPRPLSLRGCSWFRRVPSPLRGARSPGHGSREVRLAPNTHLEAAGPAQAPGPTGAAQTHSWAWVRGSPQTQPLLHPQWPLVNPGRCLGSEAPWGSEMNRMGADRGTEANRRSRAQRPRAPPSPVPPSPETGRARWAALRAEDGEASPGTQGPTSARGQEPSPGPMRSGLGRLAPAREQGQTDRQDNYPPNFVSRRRGAAFRGQAAARGSDGQHLNPIRINQQMGLQAPRWAAALGCAWLPRAPFEDTTNGAVSGGWGVCCPPGAGGLVTP